MSLKPTNIASIFALAAGACAMLGGCANVSVNESTFFADPAAYAMYDCKQLAGVRTGMARRVEELQGLMAKAETGAAGALVAEIAYRQDYVSAQAKLKLANSEWERNRCESATDPGLARPQRGSLPAAGRSTGRVY